MKKRVFVIIGIILAVALIIGAIVYNQLQNASKPVIVKVSSVSRGDVKAYLSTNAVIQSKKIKDYAGAPQIAVKMISVKVGDLVRKGQVMLDYDIFDVSMAVTQADLQYKNAQLQKTDLAKQKRQIDDAIAKQDKLIKELEASINPADAMNLSAAKQKREAMQAISSEKVKLMDNSVALAKLGYDSAVARLDKVKNGLIVDFDGVVTALNAVEGSPISPGQPAIVVQQLDQLKAVMSLGKYDAPKVKVGQEVILKDGSNRYNGIVSFISPAAVKTVSATGQNISLDAEIDIKNPSPDLKIDFDISVDILVGSVKDATKIPVECIKYNKDGKSFVFKVDGTKARQVEVKLGLQSDMEAQVQNGVSSNDMLIMNPGIAIQDGTTIQTNKDGK